jgi:hypothetical protein
MSQEKVFNTLKVVAEVLDLEPPQPNNENSWVIEFSSYHALSFTYEEDKDYLYLCCPIMEDLPQDPVTQASLYKMVLEKNLNYAQTQTGTIGIDTQNNVILFYKRFALRDIDETYLLIFLPVFIEASLSWKTLIWEAVHTPQRQPRHQPKPQRKRPIALDTKQLET